MIRRYRRSCPWSSTMAGCMPARLGLDSSVWAGEGPAAAARPVCSSTRETGPGKTLARLARAHVSCAWPALRTLFAGLDRVGGGRLFAATAMLGDWARPTAATSKTSWSGMGPHVATMATCIGTRRMTSSPVSARRTESRRSTHCTCGKARLIAGTWPQGYVLRFAGGKRWDIMGRPGLPVGQSEINETNDLEVHNGSLFAGQLPLGGTLSLRRTATGIGVRQLGRRADFAEKSVDSWMRVTALASHQGRLFAGTGSCRPRCRPDKEKRSAASFRLALARWQVTSTTCPRNGCT